jgi:hypothetical protein
MRRHQLNFSAFFAQKSRNQAGQLCFFKKSRGTRALFTSQHPAVSAIAVHRISGRVPLPAPPLDFSDPLDFFPVGYMSIRPFFDPA